MTIDKKKEFGDYQTPPDFCNTVLEYLNDSGLLKNIDAILEPTCGIGNFLTASASRINKPAYGVEINELYAEEAKKSNPSAHIETANIFDLDVKSLCKGSHVLIIGNPPWATNSELISNLPKKENFKGLKGIDAITGASNFDICEYIILQMLNAYKGTDSVICMLCKTSVARNVILEIERNGIACSKTEMLNFSSSKVFGISAAACVLLICLTSGKKNTGLTCTVRNIEDDTIEDELTVKCGIIKTSRKTADLEGSCQLVWRQGVKHDCGKIMELEKVTDDTYKNKKDLNAFRLEPNLVYPLVKSSHLKSPIITKFKKYVIVTQKKVKEDTSYIAQYPLTWEYLNNHAEDFSNRKSIIYKNSPPFCMFGVGDYSYKPYKVGLSGFYKNPLFALLYSNNGKPVMTDDTCYFLSFDNYSTAYGIMLLLNSSKVREFLLSVAFLDNKRPYTVKLLSRLDLVKCVDSSTFENLKATEKELRLADEFTPKQFDKLKTYIHSL